MNRNIIKLWMYKHKYIYIVSWNTSTSTNLLDQNILSHLWHLHFYVSSGPNILVHHQHDNFYVSAWPKHSFASLTCTLLHIYLTKIFFCICDTSISMYQLDKIFYRILDNSISSYLLDQNILSHPRHHNFFVSTRPEYSIASSTPQFLRILLNRNNLSHPWHLKFFRVYLTRIFYRILNTSPSLYLLDRNIYRIPDTSISSDLLHQNIPSHPWHLHSLVSTRPEYSIASLTPPFLLIYSTTIFYWILDTSIALYLLNQNIPSHPWHLHFYVTTRPKYSFASVTPPFLCIKWTKIFFCILNTSISTYLLDQDILLHPWHLYFDASTRPRYSFASLTPPLLSMYSTKIFVCILDTSISMHLLNNNILAHRWHLSFLRSTKYVSTQYLSIHQHPYAHDRSINVPSNKTHHVCIRAIKAFPYIISHFEVTSDLFDRETFDHHRMLADKYKPMAAPSIVPKPFCEICASRWYSEFQWNPKLESTDSSPSTRISIFILVG